MKRILFLVLLFVVSTAVKAQYPVTQFLGSDSAMVKSRGGLQGRFAPIPFTDTTSANLSRISQYPGALIYTSGVDKYWYRNATTTGWIEFTSSGGSTVNIYNSDGQLTGDRSLNGLGYKLTFDELLGFELNSTDSLIRLNYTRSGKSSVIDIGDTIKINPNLGNLLIDTLNTTQDTSTYKPMVVDPVTGRVLQSSYWYGSGGSGVNIYNSNGTLTSDRNLDGTGFSLGFQTLSKFWTQSDTVDIELLSTGAKVFNIHNLTETQDTTTYKPIVVDPITGRVLQSSYWYGGGDSSIFATVYRTDTLSQNLRNEIGVRWSLLGNSGALIDGEVIPFLGTTDAYPLTIKANNVYSGYFGASNPVLALGKNAFRELYLTTDGFVGTKSLAIGESAGYGKKEGDDDILIGHEVAFYGQGGVRRIAIGNGSIERDTSGSDQVVIGYQAQTSSNPSNYYTTSKVTAIGNYAGLDNELSNTVHIDDGNANGDTTLERIFINGNNMLGYWNQSLVVKDSAYVKQMPVGGTSSDSVVVIGADGKLKKRNTADFGGGGGDTSYFIIDTLYNRLATVINVDSMRLKSVEIKLNGSAVTPTTTDSTLSWDILASGGTTGVKSVEIVGDSAYLVNDSNTLTGTKVYGYYNGTKGWKESKKMTFVIPYDGEVVMISGDSLTNGRKVDSIYRTVGKDSIIFNIAGVRYAVKDSTGGGASGLTKGTTTIASSATGRVLYDSSGILQNNSSMTYDGTRLSLAGSSTNSALQAGKMEMQSLGVNNSWFGENVYYSSGWKARATGYTPMFYFPNGQIEIQTVAASVSAGAATTPLTRIKVQTNGRVAMGTNVQSLTAQAHLFLSNGSNTLAPFGIYLPGADVLATPVAGVFEAKVDSIYWTGNDVTRKKIALVTAGSPFLASGTATPTATNGTNVTASTPGQTQYMRVGNTVTVSGYIEITCTTLGVTSQIDLTIPVASAFTNTTQLSGTMLEAVVGVASPGHGTVISEATNDRVQIDFTPRATGSLSYRFTYTYQVL